MLRAQKQHGGILLHTCNRVEWYVGDGPSAQATARHLFSVASGLKSAFLGEHAVLGQIRDAYTRTHARSPVTSGLHRLFQHALKTGKRVRTETTIAQGALSHAQAVVQCLTPGNLRSQTILIIGAHHMNRSILNYLTAKAETTIFIANRTFETAQAMAHEFQVSACTFSELPERASRADIIISATSAPHFILKAGQFIPKPGLMLFDLAHPRDLDPELGNYPGVTLYNLQDLEARIAQNTQYRIQAAEAAEQIINEEVNQYLHYFIKRGHYAPVNG